MMARHDDLIGRFRASLAGVETIEPEPVLQVLTSMVDEAALDGRIAIEGDITEVEALIVLLSPGCNAELWATTPTSPGICPRLVGEDVAGVTAPTAGPGHPLRSGS